MERIQKKRNEKSNRNGIDRNRDIERSGARRNRTVACMRARAITGVRRAVTKVNLRV